MILKGYTAIAARLSQYYATCLRELSELDRHFIPWILVTFVMMGLAAYKVSAAEVFEETEGYVVLEAESALSASTGAWALKSAKQVPIVDPRDYSTNRTDYYFVDGAVGGKWIETKISRTGTNAAGGQGRLAYRFKINTPGVYRLCMRSFIGHPHDATEGNDVWLRIRHGAKSIKHGTHGGFNDGWYKVYTNSWERRNAKKRTRVWHWEARDEQSLDFNFKTVGNYTLQISARSKSFGIDRFVLYRRAGANDAKTGARSYGFAHSSGVVTVPRKQYQLDNLRAAKPPRISGELKRWHKTTLTMDGPQADEEDKTNPFMDYRMAVTFSQGTESIVVPGYFAADGDAANTSATSGNQWRAHFLPTKTGTWQYKVDFFSGKGIAVKADGSRLSPYDGLTGTFEIAASDKSGRDFRSPDKGKLIYDGKAYPTWQGGGGAFIKGEANVPEVFLQYSGFDGTNPAGRDYSDHAKHWVSGDPTWGDGEGKGIFGAVNYLTSLGVNAQYFLTMNVAGDGKRTYPWPHNWHQVNCLDNPDHLPEYIQAIDPAKALYIYDVSKLDQWQMVFDHMMSQGMLAQVVMTEQENQSFFEYYAQLSGLTGDPDFADSRKLYYRELIARFGYLNAVKWNMGEENGWQTRGKCGAANTTSDRLAYAKYVKELLPYEDQIVVHNPIHGPGTDIYKGLLGTNDYTGISYQGYFDRGGHDELVKWYKSSRNSGRQWILSYDEPYAGESFPNLGTWRRESLWAALTAGAAGIGFYNNQDLKLQDYSAFSSYYKTMSRATDFMQMHIDDVTSMRPSDELVDQKAWCLADPGRQYLVYLRSGGTTKLNLKNVNGTFSIKWFDPRLGGNLKDGSVKTIIGQDERSLGQAPDSANQDWAVLITRTGEQPTPPQSETSAKISTGKIKASTDWATVHLPDTYDNMVVTTSIVNNAGRAPLIPRIRNAEGNRFDVKVQRFDNQSGAVSNVQLFWMAMEAGQYEASETGLKIEARKVQATKTDRKGTWSGKKINYLQRYTRPVVLGQVMSHNDAKPSVFWSRGSGLFKAASSDVLYVGKHIGEDTRKNRRNETLGVIILEAGTGTLKTELGDYPFEAALGADKIEGIRTGKEYQLSMRPTHALINQSGMDGGDGGWAVMKREPDTELRLAIDEDTIGDSERNHTSEQVAYLVLGEQLAASGSLSAHQTVANDTLVAGINLNGIAAQVNGETWMSMNQAVAQGLKVINGTLTSTQVLPISKAVPAEMLTSFVKSKNGNLDLTYPLSDGAYEVVIYGMHTSQTDRNQFDVILENAVVDSEAGINPSASLGTWQAFGAYGVTVTGGKLELSLGTYVAGQKDTVPQLMGVAIYKK